jgi:hypothetical protein
MKSRTRVSSIPLYEMSGHVIIPGIVSPATIRVTPILLSAVPDLDAGVMVIRPWFRPSYSLSNATHFAYVGGEEKVVSNIQHFKCALQFFVRFGALLYPPDALTDRGVVHTAKQRTDLSQGEITVLPGKPHRKISRNLRHAAFLSASPWEGQEIDCKIRSS